MLIKLPNGDHINPQAVESVTKQDQAFACRVVVRVAGVDHTITREGLGCNAEAAALRDQIAEKVNAACYDRRRL